MSESVRTKHLLNEVREIQDLTKSMRVIVENIPPCSLQKAYMNSVLNLESKNEKFLAVAQPLSDEQRQAIALIKGGKIHASKIIEGFPEVPAVPSDLEKPIAKKGKKPVFPNI